jgi:ferric-dicitrate binding protein FerR (iron transport regulator)
VYCSLSSQVLTGEVVFDALGDPNASFVIKAATTLTTLDARVTLRNGAQARNIYGW